MSVLPDSYVFDKGPLQHFAQAGWLGSLRFLTKAHAVYIPEHVEQEFAEATVVSSTRALISEASWISVYRAPDLEYLKILGFYENRLASGRKNLGECGVLAMGERFGCRIVLDDADARAQAAEKKLRTSMTLSLLCQAIREKRLTLEMVEDLADDLLETEYHLPFKRGGFRQHAIENGMLDYESPL